MDDRPTAVIVYLSGHLRGTTHRLSGERLSIGSHAGAEIHVLPRELPPESVGTGSEAEVGSMVLSGRTYEIQAAPDAEIWVNGERVERRILASGDLLEIGEGGPVLRFRLLAAGSRPYKSVAEIFHDCRDVARHRGGNRLQRAGRMLREAPRELATQTSPRFRVYVVVVLALLVGMTGVLTWRNVRLEDRLAEERVRMHGLAELIESNERASFSFDQLAELQTGLEARIEALEELAQSRQEVISEAVRSIVFLQGAYGFVEREGGRPLRFVAGAGGGAAAGFSVTLEGAGPIVEIRYTGTGFVATSDGLLLTNRHVALPWEFDPVAQGMSERGLQPVMLRFRGYLPGLAEAFDVSHVRSSDEADVAVLRCELATASVPPLALSLKPPSAGEEVLVLGYPTGMNALLARAEKSFLESLLEDGPLDFWELAEGLAMGGHIAPLATLGIVGQVTHGAIVYDAETTHGGSGGPVLNLRGEVVAVNAAIVPEFGGSNMGVPADRAARLLVEE